jgi:hypothetical protein
MSRIGVLVIHGMGSQEDGFHQPLENRIRHFVKRAGANPDDIVVLPIWWAPVLTTKEAFLLDALKKVGDLEWFKLRRFVVQVLADAIAYQKTFRDPSPDEVPVYDQIHRIIAGQIHRLGRSLTQPAPLVVLGHSLGCHMISNYIWDAQTRNNPHIVDPNNPFERLETLTSITTFGCNIPLFLLANNALDPIRFPIDVRAVFPKASAPQIAEVTRWINFYDPDDILGWPLRGLSPRYKDTVDEDRAINAGGFFTSWNPASHTQYWNDDSMAKPVAANLVRMLELLRL